MPDALAATAARLRALMPGFPDTYDIATVPPDGPGWVRLDAVPVADWCADARERNNPHRLASLAAMSVGGALVHAVLARVTAGLALDTRAWDVAADALAVHRAAAGHIDRVAALRPVAWVVAGDEAARSPRGGSAAGSPARDVPGAAGASAADGGDVGPSAHDEAEPARVFPDEAALLDAVAAAAVATLAPLLRDVRAATRFGLVPLWNAAADTVRLTARVRAPLRRKGTPPDPRARADRRARGARRTGPRPRLRRAPARSGRARARPGRVLPRLPHRPARRAAVGRALHDVPAAARAGARAPLCGLPGRDQSSAPVR